MTEETKSDEIPAQENDGNITGISIASFLQMLEHEKHTCSVHINSGDKSGILYFKDGDLIDAVHEDLNGIEAAYSIVSWNHCGIALKNTTAISRNIERPLGYILLNAAKHQDEQTDTKITESTTWLLNETENSSEFQGSVDILSNIPGMRCFYILNRAEKIVVHSAPDSDLGELLIYCITTSNKLRKVLNEKSFRRIHMQMKDGSSMLIIPRAGKILGMILEEHSSADEIISRINTALPTQ